MPFSWGKKAPPQVTDSDPGRPDFLRDAPLSGSARFRVTDIYTIMGLGCVVVGTLEVGELRPSDLVRVADGASGTPAGLTLRVASIMAHRAEVPVLTVGISAGVAVRGVGIMEHAHPRETKEAIHRGDLLLAG